MTFSSKSLEEALELLGEVLEDRKESVELVAIGGGSLLLLNLIQRSTKDLDIVARVDAGHYVSASPLPGFLISAVQDVGAALRISGRWLNEGPTDLLQFGLPEGFGTRVTTRRFGGLILHIAGRRDQIFFKLYASVDQGPGCKHAVDLVKLQPSVQELADGAVWCRTHDPSAAFAQQLELALQVLGGMGER